MEASGFTVEDYASPDSCIDDGIYYDLEQKLWRFNLWPENVPAVEMYLRVQTQWRVGVGGAIGLDYNVLYRELDRAQLDPDEYEDLFDAVRVIERTVLSLK